MDKSKEMSKERIGGVSEVIESVANEAIQSGSLERMVEVVDNVSDAANTINMVKRELHHRMVEKVIDNGWYEVLTINKSKLKRRVR